jgi:hypothetical protein
MPTDDARLKSALFDLGFALSKQSIRRQEQEQTDIREIARILTKIGKIVGDIPGIQVQDLGVAFYEACDTHDVFMPVLKRPKRSK